MLSCDHNFVDVFSRGRALTNVGRLVTQQLQACTCKGCNKCLYYATHLLLDKYCVVCINGTVLCGLRGSCLFSSHENFFL